MALSWVDLHVFLKYSPRGSAVSRELNVDGDAWGVSEYLQAAMVDALNSANWQRAGDKHAKRPKPIKRPGLITDDKKLGKGAIPVRDFNAWWDSH